MSDNDKHLIARIRACEDDPTASDLEETLREALASVNNRVVGRAVTLIGQLKLQDYSTCLRAAYERFLVSPIKTDPGCAAKIPLCETLRQLEYDDADFFLAGIRYRQHEPGFGGSTDTAAELRAICGFALIQLNGMRAMDELVDLLIDPENAARAGAIRAIAHARSQSSELLLRLKISLGDPAPEVMGECFSCLLQLDTESALPRVAKFLTHPDENVCCEAALALSESRSAVAFHALRVQADLHHGSDYDQVLLTSIGLLGLPESIDYLLQVITRPDPNSAITAVRALRHCRDPQVFEKRLSNLVKQTGNPLIKQAYTEAFPKPRSSEEV